MLGTEAILKIWFWFMKEISYAETTFSKISEKMAAWRGVYNFLKHMDQVVAALKGDALN